jgi:hypothetical protein
MCHVRLNKETLSFHYFLSGKHIFSLEKIKGKNTFSFEENKEKSKENMCFPEKK